LGATDAPVIAAAERFGVREIATVDRRHFTVIRRVASRLPPFLPETLV